MFRMRFTLLSALVGALVALAMPFAALAQGPLTEEYLSTNGSLTLSYPADWAVNEEDGVIALANDPEALAMDEMPEGAIGVVVIAPEMLTQLLMGVETPTLSDVGAALALLLSEGSDGFVPDSLEEISIGDRPAIRVAATAEPGDVVFYAIDFGGNHFVTVMSVTQPGGQAPYEDTILAIASSIEYAPPWAAALSGHFADINSVAFSPDGTLLASGADDYTARVWDVATGAELLQIQHPEWPLSVVFTPDGSQLITGSDDSIVRVWDVATGESIAELTGHTDYVRGVAINPDGSLIASASDDMTIRLWAFDGTWQEHATLNGHTDWVKSVAFSPDGTLIASTSDDGTVRVWDVAAGTELLAMEHPDYVRSAVFSPDGTLIASGCDDGVVRVWDAATGDSVAELAGHTDYVRGVAFSPDGTQIASASDDTTIRVWVLDGTWQEQAVLTGHNDWANTVAFSPDGALIASGADDSNVLLWNVPR